MLQGQTTMEIPIFLGTMEILESIDEDNWYQNWWYGLFVDAYSEWESALRDTQFSGYEAAFPLKATNAARLLWGIEGLVACFEPEPRNDTQSKYDLLAFRYKLRAYIFQFVLKESWF